MGSTDTQTLVLKAPRCQNPPGNRPEVEQDETQDAARRREKRSELKGSFLLLFYGDGTRLHGSGALWSSRLEGFHDSLVVLHNVQIQKR